MANLSKTTNDHEEIRRWAEERGGKPAHVKATGSGEDIGILRIDFPGFGGEGRLEPITWEQFFEKFDERGLSLIYQEHTAAGQRSNFNKIVSAETAQENEERTSHGKSRSSRSRTTRGTSRSAKKAASSSRAAKSTAKKSSATKKKAASASKKSGAKRAASKRGATKRSTASSRKKSPSKTARSRGNRGRKSTARKSSSKRR